MQISGPDGYVTPERSIDPDYEDQDDDDDDDGSPINFKGENENTLLHEACIVGDLDMVKMLVTMGAKINRPNWNRRTPLHLACKNSHQNVAEYLVEK